MIQKHGADIIVAEAGIFDGENPEDIIILMKELVK